MRVTLPELAAIMFAVTAVGMLLSTLFVRPGDNPRTTVAICAVLLAAVAACFLVAAGLVVANA